MYQKEKQNKQKNGTADCYYYNKILRRRLQVLHTARAQFQSNVTACGKIIELIM